MPIIYPKPAAYYFFWQDKQPLINNKWQIAKKKRYLRRYTTP